MSSLPKAIQYARFLKQLWKYKALVRRLLDSENLGFVGSFPPGHFYSPLPDLGDLRKHAARVFDSGAKALPAIALNEPGQLQLTAEFAKLYPEIPFGPTKSAERRYFYDNPFFSFGDGVVLYCFLRYFKPRRVIEIGSGYSSAEMLDVNDLFLHQQTHFTFIEPYPGRLHSLLSEADRKAVRLAAASVQEVDQRVFEDLQENDILFIDSSHVGKTHSDVLMLLFEILPRLKPGVIVHFHDVLWPFEYPLVWLEKGRAWNEAYFLRAFLQYNSAFEILYFNSLMAVHHPEALRKWMPRALAVPSYPETMGNSSLWLRKRA